MTSERLLIRGGLIADGLGGAPYPADVLVEGDRIVEVGPGIACAGAQNIDATGMVVSPGFIDTHRHIDAALLRQEGYGEVELRQGVTSAVCGNCGFSLFPFLGENAPDMLGHLRTIVGPVAESMLFPTAKAFLAAAPNHVPAVNFGALVGGGSLRIALNGYASGPLSEARLRKAESLISQAMDQGAMGLSMGLMYAPENEYRPDQLVRLAAALGGRGVLAVHIRGEGHSLTTSIEEALEIGRRSGARLQISHFKAACREAWGEPYQETKRLIERAIERGQDVMVDVYPYEAGSTSLVTLLPPAWLQGGMDALLRRLGDEGARRELQHILEHPQPDWDNLVASLGFEAIRIASVDDPAQRPLIGQDLKAAARALGVGEAALIADLLIKNHGNVSMINFVVSQDNLGDALGWRRSFVISDSILSGGRPHPRYYGAFPKILRKYVRGDGLLSIGEAVRRMTSVPAERYAITRRGRIQPGYLADIAVFDPGKVRDEASYERPERMATGFRCVMVNGRIALMDDQLTGARPGRPLRPGQ